MPRNPLSPVQALKLRCVYLVRWFTAALAAMLVLPLTSGPSRTVGHWVCVTLLGFALNSVFHVYRHARVLAKPTGEIRQ